MSILSFRQELNSEQLKAVDSLHGPLLILAGAGSGKTRVLIYRIANLIIQGEATPGQILAVTFTNKAAEEMKTRTQKLLHQMNISMFEQPWVSTFHSLCAKILRQHIHLLGYQPFFAIYNDGDQLSMIKKVLRKLNIHESVCNPKSVKSKINTAKTLGIPPQEIEIKADYLMSSKELTIYKEYELGMKAANALDFTDLLYKTYELFESYPDILQVFQQKFRYIMVDEYQDTNHIQYLLVKLLSELNKNICVVGDEDQSIYSWRGADINNILDFEKDFPNTEIIKLERNYRSTKNIVEAASKVIGNNLKRKKKVLFTDHPWGEPILICGQSNDRQEARYVVQTIKSLMKGGEDSYKDFAIFYRTNAQSRVLEDQLRHQSIPYRLIGGIKFYDRKEIKDILGYMNLALNPTDDVAFKRVINTPTRGIGRATVEALENFAQEKGLGLLEACQLAAEQRVVHAGACKRLQAFYNMVEHLRGEVHEIKISEIYHLILDLTGYVQKLHIENTVESLARADNLEEFNNAILQFENEGGDRATLPNFLEKMSLVSDIDNVDNNMEVVTLMTLHVSKGLEYPNVFIVGMEDGLFPTGRAIEDGRNEIEEERRLAYVGMTRAEKRLFLTYAQMRKVWGMERHHTPSRFIKEIPEQYIKWTSRSSQPSRFLQKYGKFSQKKSHSSSGSFDDFDHMPDYENDCSEPNSYKKGMRVRHPKFGVGSIYQVEGQGESLKVGIMFSNKRVRKFVVKYTSLERL